jgi:hypothetical protein
MPSLIDHPLFAFRQLAAGKVASITAGWTAGGENPATPKSLSKIVTVQLEAPVEENTERKVCVGDLRPPRIPFFRISLEHPSQSGT